MRLIQLVHKALVMIIFAAAMPVYAASYYWDGDTGTANAQDGGGTWDTATANWLNGSTTGSDVVWLNNNVATFGISADGTYAVTLATSPSGTLAFNYSGYTLSAASAQTITFAGSTTGITVAPGKTATIGNNVTVTSPNNTTSYAVGVTNSTGGTLIIDNGGTLKNGASSGSYVLNINRTTVEVKNGGTLTTREDKSNAIFVNGTVNVTGGTVTSYGTLGIGQISTSENEGTLTISSGSVTASSANGLRFGTSSAALGGTVNLDGGTLAVSKVITGTTAPTTAVLNLNGGTLKPTVAHTDWIASGITVNVKGNGALIDTTGFNLTVGRALVNGTGGDADGGLTKLGSGTLTLSGANTYTGPTMINAGMLALSGSGSLSGTTNISLLAGATFDVSSTGFAVSSTKTLACGSTNGTATVNASGQTLTLAHGANLSFQATGGTGTSTNGRISVTGNLTLNGNTVTVNISDAELALGTYRLLECSGTLSGTTTLTLTGIALGGDKIAELHTTTGSGGYIDLVVSPPGVALFSGLAAYPAINYGATSLILGGTVSAGTVYPDIGEEVTATISGNAVTGTVSNTTGSFSINYNASSLASLTAGSYTITYVYTGHVGRLSATTNTSTSLTVNKLTPAFSNLSASTNVAYGATSLTLAGKVSAGILYPANGEFVSASINGNAVTGTVTDAEGNFSITYNAASLATLAGGVYPITYAYAGNATTLGTASDSSRNVTVVTTYYWDGTDTTGNADGGDGTWDQGTTANWDSSAMGGTPFPWPTLGTANTAVFGGTAGTVSLSSGVSVAGLSFTATGYTVQNNTITFNASGDVWANSNVTATISSALDFASKPIVVLGGGTVNLAGGTTGTAAGRFTVNGGTTVNWSGTGTLGNGGDYVSLGNSTGPGILNVTAGSLTIRPQVDAQRSFFIGYNHSSTSRLDVSGGMVTINNNANILIASGINTSTADTVTNRSELTVSGTGTFTTGTTTGLLKLGGNSFDTATVNLNSGGTFATLRSFTKGTGSSVINFNGGKIQATGNNTNWITVITANVRNNGAIIDVGTFSVTNAQALVHSTIDGDNAVDGGLTKLGSGKLTLSGANTYTGPTTVSNGVLQLTREDGLSTNTAVSIVTGATIDLAFIGTNTVKSLAIDGNLKYRNTVYGAAELPGVITGTGYLRTTEGRPRGLLIQFF